MPGQNLVGSESPVDNHHAGNEDLEHPEQLYREISATYARAVRLSESEATDILEDISPLTQRFNHLQTHYTETANRHSLDRQDKREDYLNALSQIAWLESHNESKLPTSLRPYHKWVFLFLVMLIVTPLVIGFMGAYLLPAKNFWPDEGGGYSGDKTSYEAFVNDKAKQLNYYANQALFFLGFGYLAVSAIIALAIHNVKINLLNRLHREADDVFVPVSTRIKAEVAFVVRSLITYAPIPASIVGLFKLKNFRGLSFQEVAAKSNLQIQQGVYSYVITGNDATELVRQGFNNNSTIIGLSVFSISACILMLAIFRNEIYSMLQSVVRYAGNCYRSGAPQERIPLVIEPVAAADRSAPHYGATPSRTV